MVISRGLLAVLYEKTVRGGGEENDSPSSASASPQMASYLALWALASSFSLWLPWGRYEGTGGCSVVGQVSGVFSLQSSYCIPLPQAFASPKWLSPDIAVSLLSCLFRVWPGHSLKTANSRVLYYPLVGPKLCQPFVKSLGLPIGLSVQVFALFPVGILPALVTQMVILKGFF